MDTADWTTPAIIAVALGALALLLAVVALLRTRRLQRRLTALGGGEGAALVDLVGEYRGAVETLRGDVAGLARDTRALRVDLGDAIRHLSVVRYDAFGDMGGRLSFSVALLDDDGDGVVLTSIAGRSESRTYAKGIKAGRSDVPLAPEEEQAVQFAAGAATRSRRPAGDA